MALFPHCLSYPLFISHISKVQPPRVKWDKPNITDTVIYYGQLDGEFLLLLRFLFLGSVLIDGSENMAQNKVE